MEHLLKFASLGNLPKRGVLSFVASQEHDKLLLFFFLLTLRETTEQLFIAAIIQLKQELVLQHSSTRSNEPVKWFISKK